MTAIETTKVKADTEKGYRVINKSAFDPKTHKAYEDDAPNKQETEADRLAREESERDAARRKVEANRGQVAGGIVEDTAKNPSGTYSEPTPTDIRYPNKNDTEFENNHGAYISKSAAQMREDEGLPDKPGGLNPDKKEAEDAKVAEAKVAAKLAQDGEAEQSKRQTDASEFDGMTVAELKDHAETNGIDLGDATKKADILAKVKAA